MLERPCKMAGLGGVEEEVGADAIDLTTESVKGIPDARTSGGSACQAGKHPISRVSVRPP